MGRVGVWLRSGHGLIPIHEGKVMDSLSMKGKWPQEHLISFPYQLPGYDTVGSFPHLEENPEIVGWPAYLN